MELVRKIAAVVFLQVTLIIASFLVIMYFESQTVLTGNTVNVAGKNRLLTSEVQNELNRVLFHGTAEGVAVFEVLDRLEENIHFLKRGGSMSGIEIPPLSPRFDDSWGDVAGMFEQYRDAASALLASGENVSATDMERFEQVGARLIALSDILTERLGHDVEDLSAQLMALQAILGTVNVVIHVLLVVFIWTTFRIHMEKRVRMEKFSTIGEFAAMMAHDMRNPLGTIRNSLGMIQKGDMPQNSVDAEMHRINRSIRRMSHQIEGVLNYVRAVPLVLEPVPVLDVLDRSLDAVTVPPNIELRLPEGRDGHGGGMTVVMCDAEKLEFVFVNLLLNAVQAIGDSPGHIEIRLHDAGPGKEGAVTLEFENSGSRITQDDMARVFDPLFTTKMQGTGLGLTSCRNIIERHNGSITASSDNDRVTFTIRLPKDRGADDGRHGEQEADTGRR